MNPKKKFLTRKQELMSQITQLINEVGYENITVRGICSKLEISTGTFYHYFSDKGDLALALFADIDEYFNSEVASQFGDNEIANLKIFCAHYGKYNLRNGIETARCINMAPYKNDNVNYLNENRYIFQLLLNLLNVGVEKQQFHLSISSEETARMIMVILRGYSSDWSKRSGSYDLVNAIDGFINLFIKSLT